MKLMKRELMSTNKSDIISRIHVRLIFILAIFIMIIISEIVSYCHNTKQIEQVKYKEYGRK